MQTPFYFLFNTLLLCASFYMSIAQGGEGYIHTFIMCLGAFILGHLVTEALNYEYVTATQAPITLKQTNPKENRA